MLNLKNKIGISTACFYPEPTEKAFDNICKLKVPVCEIFINTYSETKINFLHEIKLKADDNNIKIVSIHPYFSAYESFLFFTDYDKRRFFDSIDLYKQFFEAAQFLGSDYIIFHGLSGAQMRLPVEEYSERFLLIDNEARKYNCELLHENLGTINEYIQDLRDVNIRFTLDFKQSAHRGYDVPERIEKMGENLAHIHLNDMIAISETKTNKTEDCRLPLAGDLDYRKIFGMLDDINYIGSFIIEVYRYNYKSLTEISDSIEKLREFLKNL
jgi:sugar phosphate isomerase/epimerase